MDIDVDYSARVEEVICQLLGLVQEQIAYQTLVDDIDMFWQVTQRLPFREFWEDFGSFQIQKAQVVPGAQNAEWVLKGDFLAHETSLHEYLLSGWLMLGLEAS